MTELSYMVCARTDEVETPPEESSTTACVECGTDIWIADVSRKQLGELRAAPLCTRCAARLAQEYPAEIKVMGAEGVSEAELEGLKMEAKELLAKLAEKMSSSVEGDIFENMKTAANLMNERPDAEWPSIVLIEDNVGTLMPAVPLQRMIDEGIPKEVIARQIIPAMAHAANAKHVYFGISSWALIGVEKEEIPDGPISEHPDRKEMLLLIEVTADGVQRMSSAEITQEGGRKRLGEWVDSEKPSESTGLFVDTLIPTLKLIRSIQEGGE